MNSKTGNTYGLSPTGFQMQEDVAWNPRQTPLGCTPGPEAIEEAGLSNHLRRVAARMRGRGCDNDFTFLATRIQSLESWSPILSFLWPSYGPWAALITRRLLPKIK